MKNNKVSVGIFIFFGLNAISSWCASSGAFEVIHDGTILYSGIAKKTIPTVDEILSILKNIS